MRTYKRLIILYNVFMLAVLAAIVIFCQGRKLSTDNVASYDAQELKIYRQVWDQIGDTHAQSVKEALTFGCVTWGVVFLAGWVFMLLLYFLLIKPARDMEGYAEEIAKGNLDVPIPIYKENLFGSFTESFDIMREELRSAKEREREAEKAKREMVAELSHDLKTPVATIQATCEVMDLKLRMKLEKAESEESAREIRENLEKVSFITKKADTIQQLVANVFRATLEDMQEIKVEPKECDSRVIEGYFKSLKEYGNVILGNHVPECLVYLDKLRMEQVIDNVVGNAYKYAGTDVHVLFQETESMRDKDGSANRFLKITIRDEGPGVPEEELPLLTQKFYRGKDVQEKQGYGLGLYLVKWYLEKQGGGLEYHNDHGFVVEIFVKKV